MAINIKNNSSSSAIKDSKNDSLTNDKNNNDRNSLRIFISYSSKDLQIAEKVEKYLQQRGEEEEAGFSTWRDKRSIEADWSNEIADALTKQDIVLLLWTKNASESDYVKSEWMTARALGKVIKPILFSKDFTSLHLPKPLENVQALTDLERIDEIEKNFQKLLYPLNLLSKEKTPFTFKYDYNILPAKHQIPFLPNPDFIGRSEELVNLYLDVIGGLNKLNHAHVGIVGIGGVGKTQLAIEFTYRYAFQFEKGIYWIQGIDQSKWLSQIVNIAIDLGLKVPENDEINKEKNYFHAFYDYCKEFGSRTLLIIDNVEDPRSLNNDRILFRFDPSIKFRILELECNILFTTRRDFVLPSIKMHNINLLSPESSLLLLTKYRQSIPQYQQLEKEEKYAEMICNSVGYLPLALVLIQAYLRKYQDVSFKDYYEEIIKNKMGSIDLDEVPEDQLATRHAAAIRSTLDQDWKMLEEGTDNQNQVQRNKNTKKLLSLLSLFPESASVPKARLIIFSGIERYGETRLVRPAESAFIYLDELNLVDVLENNKSVRIHPLLREYVLEKLEDITENQPINLKAESILNVKRAYYDSFSALVMEYSERECDIDSVIEDFRTVISWLRESETGGERNNLSELSEQSMKEDTMNIVSRLNQILEQESHNLRLLTTQKQITTREENSVLFAQQIHIRSFELNYTDVAEKSRKFLSASNVPFLNILWNKGGSKQTLMKTLGHGETVTSVAISPDNTKIVSGALDSKCKVWDLNSGRLLTTLEGHGETVTSVAISPDNTKIVSGSNDHTVKVWDLDTGKPISTLSHGTGVFSVAISPDNTKIVSGSGSGWGGDIKIHSIKVWDLNSGRLLTTLEGHGGVGVSVTSVAISPDNTKIVSGSDDNTIKVWNLEKGKLISTLSNGGGVNSVAISPDSTKIVSGYPLKVWDLNSGRLISTLGHGSSVAISPDNTKIVSGSYDHTIRVWDLDTARLLTTLEGHEDVVTSVAISPDNTKIVSGSDDHTIKVWDRQKAKCFFSVKFDSGIKSIALFNSGSMILILDKARNLYRASLSMCGK